MKHSKYIPPEKLAEWMRRQDNSPPPSWNIVHVLIRYVQAIEAELKKFRGKRTRSPLRPKGHDARYDRVDWTDRDSNIARKLGVTPQRIGQMRRALGKPILPRSRIAKKAGVL